jgi:hypothetical protein
MPSPWVRRDYRRSQEVESYSTVTPCPKREGGAPCLVLVGEHGEWCAFCDRKPTLDDVFPLKPAVRD